MDSILIVGTETVAGTNLAAHWRDRDFPVEGVSGHFDSGANVSLDQARQTVAQRRPGRVLFCGPAADSAWSQPAVTAEAEHSLRVWTRVVREAGCALTYLSSDALFTGPWVFHAEDSAGHCSSREATRLRSMEEIVGRMLPEALILRTHLFGWSPQGEEGWVEQLLGQLERGTATVDPAPHATPLLATDLAEILERAHEEELTGVLHVGGGERVGQAEFLRGLADHFALPQPVPGPACHLTEPSRGFGRGETALQSRRAKNLLNLALPLLGEGLARLRAQGVTGFRGRLLHEASALERAA